MKSIFYAGAAAILTVAALAAVPVISASPTRTAAHPKLGSFGVDLTGMDKSVAPGDDFYAFINGNWNKRTEIPADRASWGSFNVLRDLSDQRTRDVIMSAPADSKVGMLYHSFMNEAAIDAAGAAPLRAPLAEVAAITTPAELAAYFARANRIGVGVPIGIGIGQDIKNNTQYVPQIAQAGLGMPDRDYYLKDDPKFAETRAKYLTYIETVMRLAGQPDPAGAAQRIFAFEKSLAEVQQTRAERRQVEKRYNPVATASLGIQFPGFDWSQFMSDAGVASQPRVIVGNIEGMQKTAALTGALPMATMREYLAFHVISARAALLSKPFVDANFDFAAPRCPARRRSRIDGSAASILSTKRLARKSAKCTWRATSRRRRKQKPMSWCTTSLRRWMLACRV